MLNLLNYSDFVNELNNMPSNKWVDWDLSKLDQETLDIIWNMYTESYAKEGLDFSAGDAAELRTKYKATKLIDVDNDRIPDAFIIYRTYPKYGNKGTLMGTNGKKDAKRAVVKKLINLVNTKGWFIEASKKMEELMLSVKAPVIDNDQFIMDVVGDKKKPIIGENGYFTRELSKNSKRIKKRFYGKIK